MRKKLFLIQRLYARTHGRFAVRRHAPLFTRLLLLAVYLAGTGLAAAFFFMLLISPTLPNVDNIRHLVAAQSSVILDRNGEELYAIHGDENRQAVTLDRIARPLIDATLAIEDERFYRHGGIDFIGVLRATFSNLGGGHLQGASTITQQFVKNAFLSSERTYVRKIKEAALAFQLERRFSKDEILEMYLNRINYGSNIYGVELAAQSFFGKSATELTIAESAILASIPKAPTYFSPYGGHKYAALNLDEAEVLRMEISSEQELVDKNPDFISKGLLGKTYYLGQKIAEDGTVVKPGVPLYIKGRVDFVLDRMRDLGHITDAEFAAAVDEAEHKEFREFRDAIVAPHFVLYVRELLEEKYGKEAIEQGGFRVTTTLDLTLQKDAEEAVARYAEGNDSRFGANNASLVAADPQSGHILAMVGSRDYWNDDIDGQVNVALRPRLPGSSFKPIVYAAAFLQGYAPATVLYDVQTKFGAWYEPDNFDGEFLGPVTMRKALGWSRNIPAVKAAYLAGVPNVLSLARSMGIQLNQPDDWYGLSLALGAGEVRLTDMVLAYSVFASGGYRLDPVVILKVEDRDGNILMEYEAPEKPKQILDPQVAYLISSVLSDKSARPEGYWRDRLSVPGQINAAKTGTSNKEKENPNYNPNDPESEEFFPVPSDGWTFGYTTRLAAGVWIGNTDGTPLHAKASGLDAAGGIWRDFMAAATAGMPAEEFERPEGIRFVRVSRHSGKLPSEFTPEEDIVTEVFASFSVPTEEDASYQIVEIDKVSGKLATEFTPQPARELKPFFSHHSILPDNVNWEEAVRKWAEENRQDEPIPTEYDDVHTAEDSSAKPEVRLIAPLPGGRTGPPFVEVIPAIQSPAGVSQVEYYWDDELMVTVTEPPYRGRFALSVRDNPAGSKHTVRAVVFDRLYRSAQASAEVMIGDDALPPQVRFLRPSEGDTVAAGSFVTAAAEAYDADGAVAEVRFYLDDALLGSVKSAPFHWGFFTPQEAGERMLRAVAEDYEGHTSEAALKIALRADTPEEGETRLLKPRPQALFNQGDSVEVQGYIEAALRSGAQKVILFAKKEGESRPAEVVSVAAVPGVALYTLLWEAPSPGRYELSLKVVAGDGKVRFTEKVPVIVR